MPAWRATPARGSTVQSGTVGAIRQRVVSRCEMGEFYSGCGAVTRVPPKAATSRLVHRSLAQRSPQDGPTPHIGLETCYLLQLGRCWPVSPLFCIAIPSHSPLVQPCKANLLRLTALTALGLIGSYLGASCLTDDNGDQQLLAICSPPLVECP